MLATSVAIHLPAADFAVSAKTIVLGRHFQEEKWDYVSLYKLYTLLHYLSLTEHENKTGMK